MRKTLLLKLILPVIVCAGLFLYFRRHNCRVISPDDHNVRLITRDKVILKGMFFAPSSREKFTFVLLHGLGSIKEEWNGFADRLRKEGYGYLMIDLRGHGQSRKDTEGRDVKYETFTAGFSDSQWTKMTGDLESVIKYLNKSRNIPDRRIVLAGASLGANISFVCAARNYKIPFVILLSPGWNYAGVGVRDSIKSYGKRPAFIAASPEDKYAYDSSKAIYSYLVRQGSDAVIFDGTGNAHGVQMFDGRLDNALIEWIKRNIQ